MLGRVLKFVCFIITEQTETENLVKVGHFGLKDCSETLKYLDFPFSLHILIPLHHINYQTFQFQVFKEVIFLFCSIQLLI